IVTLYDVGQDGNSPYMVMEFLRGRDLKLINASGSLTLERALRIAIQICAGVGYAHRAGLVHAALKPHDIMIMDQNDSVKVIDFGAAVALAHSDPLQTHIFASGVPQYFAPEQALGEIPSPASDVYSIGVLMFEMLTGKLPFAGQTPQEFALAHIHAPIPHMRDLNPLVPDPLDRIVCKVMAKNPASRYRNADKLGRILIDYQRYAQKYAN